MNLSRYPAALSVTSPAPRGGTVTRHPVECPRCAAPATFQGREAHRYLYRCTAPTCGAWTRADVRKGAA